MKSLTGLMTFLMGAFKQVVQNNNRFFPRLFVLLFLLALILSACGGAPGGGTSVWIDVPLDGLRFSALQEIKIEGHAAAPAGISRVEIWINGALLATQHDPPAEGALTSFHAAWVPTAPGDYTIQAIAVDRAGVASQPDSAHVSFGMPGVTPDITATPVITVTPLVTVSPVVTGTYTATSPPQTVIQFWAEPAEIEAGACTSIRWHVENVQRVIFGGLDQPFDGSYDDCLCANQRYTLTAVLLDGKEDKRTVDITVNGSCVTPTSPPPMDTTPPPAPAPAVPADGLSITCKGSQTLTWLPVEDPSGISSYQVEVQRHAGDNNWQAAPGGNLSLAEKTTSVTVECGWYYRWRVRAVDSLGNTSEWSGWSRFAITLS